MKFDLDNAFAVHEQAVVLRARRAQILSENLANADTPGYKAVDMDFKTAMHDAVRQLDAGKMMRTNQSHMAADESVRADSRVFERAPMQPSLDGNTVNTQVEQSEFLRNAIEYQVSLRLLNGKIKGLMSAIKGE